MIGKYSTEHSDNAVAFGSIIEEYDPADTDLPVNVKAVLFNADGTCDIKNPDGSAVTGIPVKAMVPLPVVPARVTAMATATKCYLVRG